jgi:hypothetical protein
MTLLLVAALATWVIIGVVLALVLGRAAGARSAAPVRCRSAEARSEVDDSDSMAA